MQTPEPFDPGPVAERSRSAPVPVPAPPPLWGAGARMAWVAGLVLAVSAFTGWYTGAGEPAVSVLGWNTGALGKLVFVIGVAVVVLVVLRELGIELPASVPESLIVIALGALATIFVVIRLLSIPDEFFGTRGRGIGIYISLLAALAVIVAGLLRASEEL